MDHFKRIKNRLLFINAWKAFLAQQKEKQVEIWASNAQWHMVWN